MKSENQTTKNTKEILDLWRFILNSETGITINEIQSRYGISHRTAERRLQAILNVDADVDKWKKQNEVYVRYGRTGGDIYEKTTI